MCGILFRLHTKPTVPTKGLPVTTKQTPQVLRLTPSNVSNLWDHLTMMVARRGPDAQKTVNFTIPITTAATKPLVASLFTSVLHLRGMDTVAQPLTDPESGSLFCWNGELFNEEAGLQVDEKTSDTTVLFNSIFQKPSSPVVSFKESLLSTLSTVRGPWAILIYHAPTSTLYFGRDVLGRRSLVVHFPNSDQADSESVVADSGFWISSVSGCVQKLSGSGELENSGDDGVSDVSGEDGEGCWWGDGEEFWYEVPADGIYSVCLKHVDLGANKQAFKSHLVHHPWVFGQIESSQMQLVAPTNPILNNSIPTAVNLPSYKQLDSPSTEPQQIPPPASESAEATLAEFTRLLSASVTARVQTITQQAQMHHTEPEPLAILFSGGLDCMVLAALAAKNLPPGSCIDLLNVAFDNPRVRRAAVEAAALQAKKEKKSVKKLQKGGKRKEQGGPEVVDVQSAPVPSAREKTEPISETSSTTYPSHLFAVPDRKTGLNGYEELKRTFPDTVWRFVQIDIEFEEAQELKPWIMGLVSPLKSVMDLSIALAFWFASRGRGTIIDEAGERVPYETTAKVLLSGLGADEQLGGYNRHRKHFEISGWEGLLGELQKDVSRISKRNLGRDDRIVSDHGREIRFPFLSEAVVAFASAIPVEVKTDPRLPRGVGDKLLLRQMASSLTLARAAGEVKRAVQFGARTAKMEDGREKGTSKIK
ncbi:UNVERIFIED_CONTAM: Asparagine synthetase domain-containing protein 1 [Siphonaria sp. JEL0065]|nr:Asparagine synthetase domain-containing protein 1 [Siphonaria sp. JEL0065]